MQLDREVVDSEEQLTDKTRRRRRLLKKIIRNNRQVASDKQFQILLNLDKELFAGYNAHRLGNFCIQQNRLQLAQQNLLRAKQLIEKKFLFTNVYVSFGNLEVKRKNFAKACEYYEKVLELSPHKNSKVYLNKDQVVFAGKLNSFNSYFDAHDQLIKIYVETNQFNKGFIICKAALQLKQQQQSAIINFADTLEKLLGNRNQALNYAWNKLLEETKTKGNQQLINFQPVQIKPWKTTQGKYTKSKKINVLSVKWGSKYSSQHVNKLYAGIKRNTTWQIEFYCFTDDSYGIDKNIKIKPLDDEWKKQWGKAVLFGSDTEGKKFYVDLDTVITGSLDQMFEYEGEFATLNNVTKEAETYSHYGYKSTVMIWKGDSLKPVYEKICNNFQMIEKLLIKFDYWLDLLVKEADDLEKLYPGKIINFKPNDQTFEPQKHAIVHFPKKPKPEDYPTQWVRKHWTT